MTQSTHNVPLTTTAASTTTPYAVQDGAAKPKPKQKQIRSQAQEAALDLVLGSTAGMVGKLIEYPFDTVKVRLQSSSRYAGPLDCFAQSMRTEGMLGLYRGISAPMFGAAIETSSLFFSYRLAQDALERTLYRGTIKDEPLPLTALIACGAVSGAFTSMLLTPIELVKCQMQVPPDTYGGAAGQTRAQRSPVTVIASVYSHGGLAGFWRGQMGTLIRETGGSAAWFGSYESVKALFRRRAAAAASQHKRNDNGAAVSAQETAAAQTIPIWQQMIAGACAGMAYNFAFYPADTIKSRMQTEQMGGSTTVKAPRVTFLDIGRDIWREQGLRGMYRGCGITVARAAPSSAFIFSIYETLRTWLA